MGFRFKKSIKIAKGVRVNFGKTGASISVGSSGFRQTFHTSGRRTTSYGIPGTGLSYVTSNGGGKKRAKTTAKPSAVKQQQDVKIETADDMIEQFLYILNTLRTVPANVKVEGAQDIVDSYDFIVNSLKTIHTNSVQPLNWEQMGTEEAPFDPEYIGPRESMAREALENYKPSFIQSIFKSMAERARADLEQAIRIAEEEDRTEYEDWLKVRDLSKSLLGGDIDAYFEIINETNAFDGFIEIFCSDLSFGCDNPEEIEAEFQVMIKDYVPDFSITLTKTGRLSRKELTKTAYFELVQDYVCSCAIAVARSLFALLPSPLERVIINVSEEAVDGATGHLCDVTILSVLFDRYTMDRLNMDHIDPSDAIGNFKNSMKFLKTSGFKPTRKITQL